MVHVRSVRIPAHHGRDRAALARCRHLCDVGLERMGERVYQAVTVPVACCKHDLFPAVKPSDQQVQPHLACGQQLGGLHDEHKSDFVQEFLVFLLDLEIEQVAEFQDPDIRIQALGNIALT